MYTCTHTTHSTTGFPGSSRVLHIMTDRPEVRGNASRPRTVPSDYDKMHSEPGPVSGPLGAGPGSGGP